MKGRILTHRDRNSAGNIWGSLTGWQITATALLICLLSILSASIALADGGSSSPGSQGGPTLSQVKEGIEDHGIQTVELPHTDPQAANELPHRDLNRDQANELLTEVFGPVLEGPAGIFDELEVEKFYSDHVALIEAGDQPGMPGGTQPTLLESSLPLRAETAGGHEEAVDLELEKSEGEIQPANPLVEVGIPPRIEEGLSLPESGVQINLAGAPAERAPSTIDQSIATYPNVAEDTTFVVAPTPTGLETFTLLQSPDAPTSQTFNLTLPNGASLRESEDGGAEVSRDGETLVAIRPPSALDANGDPVPVRLETSGTSVVITAQPSEDSAFPILVDPIWETYYWFQQATTSFAGWDNFSNSNVFTTSHNGWHAGGAWAPGLQIASGNTAITPGAQARWDYHVPRWHTDVNSMGEPVRPKSFINRVIFEKLFFDVQAYANPPAVTPDPFFAFYIWDEVKPGFVAIGHRFGNEGNLSNMNYQYNLYNTAPPNENVNAKQASLELVSSQTKSQYRQLYVGLAGVELSDKNYPNFSPLKEPDEWLGSDPEAIEFLATDEGLGLREISVAAPSRTVGGTYHATQYSPGCTGGQMSPCPRNWSSESGPAVKLDPSTMPQGENFVTIDAIDVLGHRATQKPGVEPGTGVIQVDVDRTAPVVAPFEGTLSEQGKVGAGAAQYTLKYSATDGDHESATALAPYGSPGTGAGQMQRPMGVAIDGDGNIWTVDRENNRVQKYNAAGQLLLEFGSFGSANGQFNDPRGIAVSSNGTVWVTEVGNKRVQAFNSKGEFIRKITHESIAAPYGVATAPGNVLWVADPVTASVSAFNENGSFIGKAFGSASNPNGPSNFTAPVGVATDATGYLWVADWGANNVKGFKNGQFQFQFGSAGSGGGQLSGPFGIAVAGSGNLLVTDETNSRVQVFQPSGRFLRQFGSVGSGNGQFKEPKGIAAGPNNTAIVADAGNRRLARWSHADLDAQSGVVSTEVKVDGQLVEPKHAPGCPTRNCAVSREWTLKANDFASGQHEVQVTATDGVGLTKTRTLAVSTSKDVTDPNLSSSSPFFFMPKGWVEQKSYPYSINASDIGGHGVASLTLKLDGEVVKSTTQNCPGGACTATLSGSIDMSTYEGGTHPLEVVAADASGNIDKWNQTINVAPKGEVPATEAVATLEASDQTSESTVVASTDEVVDPAEQAAGNEPGLEEEGGVLVSTGTANQSTIAVDPSEGFTIESPDGPLHVEPVNTGEASTPLIVAESVAATSANSSGSVDTVIRPVFQGVFDYQSIRDLSAPEEYTWEVDLGKNQELVLVDSQYAAVKHKTLGLTAYAIMADPAHDAIGTTIETSLSVTGNMITLTVPHKGGEYVYPVVGGVGWEGGFTTSLAVMPPPEITDEELVKGLEPGPISMMVGPPEPLWTHDPEEAATASGIPMIKGFGFADCSFTSCALWEVAIGGFFSYNGNKAWYPKKVDPVCSKDSTFYDIDEELCDWVGPNHQFYGNGYHITAQGFWDVEIKGITREVPLTIRAFGSGGVYAHDNDRICNPSVPSCA